MNKFYGRKTEIKLLKNMELMSKDKSFMTFIIGNRRIGKTALVNHCFNNKKNSLYFFVERKTEKQLVVDFLKIIDATINNFPRVSNFEDLFLNLQIASKNKPLNIIFDEFQNFEYVNQAIFSTIQKLWDKNKNNSKINLVCVGSIYSLMQKIFTSKKEPLYGRADSKMYLKPFDIVTLKTINKDNNSKSYSVDKMFNLYVMFNGVAKYYDYLQNYNLFSKNSSSVFSILFLNKNSPLQQEGKDKIIEEFGKDYTVYFSILSAISELRSPSLNKISSLTGVSKTSLSAYLSNLEGKYNLISKQSPILTLKSKKGRYIFIDNLLNFWFRFIYSNQNLINFNQTDVILKTFNDDFRSYKGVVFEKFCQSIFKNSFDNFEYLEWGSYWDKNIEIDIVGINKKSKEIFLVECKLSSKSINSSTVANFKNKCNIYLENFKNYNYRLAFCTLNKVKQKNMLQDKFDVEIIDEEDLDRLIK